MNHRAGLIIQKMAFIMLLLTGFAQMPIFKRYYIAEIPGLGWLADFELTHMLHYGFAVVFCFLFFYHVTSELLTKSYAVESKRQKADRIVRYVMVAGIVGTGMILVIKNLTYIGMSAWMIIGLDVSHLGLVMVLILYTGFCMFIKKT